MSSIKIINKSVGYIMQPTPGTDPIVVGSELIRFGRYTQTFGAFAAFKNNQVVLTERSREINDVRLSSKELSEVVMYDMISMLPLYRMMGAASVTSEVYTIAPLDIDTEKPLYATRYNRKSETEQEIDHLIDNKSTTLIIGANYLSGSVLKGIETYKGLNMPTPSFSGDTTTPPSHPTGVTNKPFNILDTFSWDTAGAPLDMTKFVAEFSINVVDAGMILPPEVESLINTQILDAQLFYSLTITIMAGKSKVLRDFHNAFLNSTTKVNLEIKHLQNTGSNYIDLECNSIIPIGKPERQNLDTGQEFDTFQYLFINFVPSGKDGVIPPYYGL